jgi:TrmH family RNA methyltransferase
VAVVFGRERSGLTNEEIDRCQLRLNIPANPDYSSLNLGAAVQVVSYALRAASLQAEPAPTPVAEERHPLDEVAETQVLESFYGHLEKVLTELDFLSQSNPTLIMRRLRCLYDRAEPTVRELNILRGALSATENLMKSPDQRAVENSDECD